MELTFHFSGRKIHSNTLGKKETKTPRIGRCDAKAAIYLRGDREILVQLTKMV